MYTDTHAHLTYLDTYQHDKPALLANLKEMNVSRIMAICCEFGEIGDIRQWVDLSNNDINIGMSIGLHPCQDKAILKAVSVDNFVRLNDDKVWAFGETGLDYHWDNTKKAEQKHSFATHIHASQTLKKPIIVHTRSAYHDTLDLLKAEKCEHGIIHCFTEDYAFAKTCLDMGLYISFSGIVSFKKSVELQEVAKKLPLDRILIETDSPYLAPVPKRGRDNEPSFVPYVARALGDIFGKSADEIGVMTSANFDNLLNQYG
ncbi:TatD family hydrolase [Moraxella bovis]|uniref:TatD family hydrolase n=1 Tax=Moraxella bovis TaxID=476 RepID=UPI002225CFBE|nr:TatD family hydrolase [Moraxella bovis]UYZ69211.1 TatD family hydrolase [Moraxella bovis]UYZ71584.1 TatD family hydrolase [Moraxella bovis]UYZ72502.1 TatD family hydrolase [Moraxella bovis]UZA14879.1 TatD family hydrolase [Moraxella bovis]UZA26759.1 TatD family hydrolase [Moraxella bovis]